MNIKAIIGQFVEQTSSTSIYEFLNWIECKEEYQKEIKKLWIIDNNKNIKRIK